MKCQETKGCGTVKNFHGARVGVNKYGSYKSCEIKILMQDGDDKIDAPDRNIAAFAIEEADDLTIHCTPFTQR